jgi:predicted phage gp36 major capsid-like protein
VGGSAQGSPSAGLRLLCALNWKGALGMQINDLQRQKYEWQAQVEEAEREAAELMAPTVRQYQSELVVLHEELDEATAKVTKNLKELEEVGADNAACREGTQFVPFWVRTTKFRNG